MYNTAMTYKVALKHTEEGVRAWVPGLPGCWSEGTDETEAIENIKNAIREYLEVAAELLEDHDMRSVEVTN